MVWFRSNNFTIGRHGIGDYDIEWHQEAEMGAASLYAQVFLHLESDLVRGRHQSESTFRTDISDHLSNRGLVGEKNSR